MSTVAPPSSTGSFSASRSSPPPSCRRRTRPARETCGDVMKHPPERDWMIVAPWWQWTDPATVPPGTAVSPLPFDGRLSKPVFQKYDSPNLVNAFIADPQHSLKFVSEDLVHIVQNAPAPSANGSKLLRISASFRKKPDGSTSIVDQRYVPDGTNTRKIFLDT